MFLTGMTNHLDNNSTLQDHVIQAQQISGLRMHIYNRNGACYRSEMAAAALICAAGLLSRDAEFLNIEIRLTALSPDLLELFHNVSVVFLQIGLERCHAAGINLQQLVCVLHGGTECLAAGQDVCKCLQTTRIMNAAAMTSTA